MTRYSRQDVLRILHLRARQLTAWEQAGLIPPNQEYSFEDLAQLRTLRTLRLGGPGVTDEGAAQLAHCDGLTLLAIPAARLTDSGVAALAKLPNLAELSIDVPPLTAAALKSFGRCKKLKTFNIGKDAPPETENKLKSVVPGLNVNRAAAE